MKILHLAVGDLIQMRKPHPCGTDRFKILRVGSNVRVICLGCGRDMDLERVKLEKAILHLLPADGSGHSDDVMKKEATT